MVSYIHLECQKKNYSVGNSDFFLSEMEIQLLKEEYENKMVNKIQRFPDF